MRRVCLGLAVACTAFISVPVAAQALPTLTASSARYFSKVALKRNFGSAFYAPTFKAKDCVRRSRVRVRCAVGWFAGDVSFYGHSVIWLTDEADGVNWNYAYTITRLDTYCSDVRKRPLSECSKTYRVK